MKQLYPSFAPPEKWRNKTQSKKLKSDEWRLLREKILKKDNYTCAYCQYRLEKYQIVDHINGDPEDNNLENLQTICQMCNIVKHAGQGCVIQDIVDLYREVCKIS
ncbi:HNH endonuclease [Candidatus Woesearchaeota archaeon]|nr:HNH endonuclease [Candidatus Woesearchaeota archaeon]